MLFGSWAREGAPRRDPRAGSSRWSQRGHLTLVLATLAGSGVLHVGGAAYASPLRPMIEGGGIGHTQALQTEPLRAAQAIPVSGTGLACGDAAPPMVPAAPRDIDAEVAPPAPGAVDLQPAGPGPVERFQGQRGTTPTDGLDRASMARIAHEGLARAMQANRQAMLRAPRSAAPYPADIE